MFRIVAFLVAWPAFSARSSAQAPTVVDLRVENQCAPQGLDTLAPRFSWSVVDPDRGAAQRAYRVLVASHEALLDANVGDLWDSGDVASTDQLYVPYGGAALARGGRYWWKVRVQDDTGILGPWSDGTRFDLAPDPAAWGANYLWDGDCVENDTAYFRREFTLPQTPTRVKVYVSAHEEFALWLNGTLLARGPAPADPVDGLRFVSMDVADHVVVGPNALAARVHWDGGAGNAGVRAMPAFILRGEAEFADGTRASLVSDASWKVLAATPYDESAPLRGPIFGEATAVEDFDARREPLGWQLVGFDDSEWDSATVVQPGFTLRSQEVPPRSVLEVLPAQSVVHDLISGTAVVDFGQNAAGWIRLRIHGAPAGARVVVHYSEELEGGRIVRDRDNITNLWDAYTCRGDAEELWEPDLGYMGFRYVEVVGYPGTLSKADVELVRCGTPLTPRAVFDSPSAELAQLLRICAATQEACAQGSLVDCPQREQSQHIMDAYIQAWNVAWNYGDTNLFAKCLRDIRDSSIGFGLQSSHHPSERFTLLPEWSLAWVLGVEQAWTYSGDRALLDELYPDVATTLDLYASFIDPDTGLILELAVPSYPFQYYDNDAPGRTALNALMFEALRIGSRMAQTVGEPSDAARFTAAKSALGAAMRGQLFDGKDAYYDGLGSASKSQLASALPLLFGIESGERAERIAAGVRRRGLVTGTIDGFFVTRVFNAYDLGDELFAALTDPTRHWGAMLAAGATTTWESWDTTYSLSHAWTAYPMVRVLDGLVGIAPLAPGWASVAVRPRVPRNLSFVEGSVPTPRGTVYAKWSRTDVNDRLDVCVPANMRAVVSVPTRGLAHVVIWEGNRLLFQKGGFVAGEGDVLLDGVEPDYVRFSVPAGTYLFRVQGTAWTGTPGGASGGVSSLP